MKLFQNKIIPNSKGEIINLQHRSAVVKKDSALKSIIIILVLTMFFITGQNAYALVTVTWDAATHSLFDGAVGTGSPPTTSIFTVTDTSLAGNGVVDKINVLVNSTSFPSGITLTLTETGPNTGVFKNTNLIFTNGTGTFGVSSTQTIGINKPSLAGTRLIISGPSSTDGIQVFSTTDSTTGSFMNLTETGPHTGIFTNKLKLTSAASINGSTIRVTPGDTVSIENLNNLDTINELVTPNPDPAFGAVPAKYNDFVSAVYKGVKASTQLSAGTAPGGGGGGLIRPSLVLDIIAGTIGGSTYIVQPPSFGGSDYHFSDGLTFTQGNSKSTFDISHYNQDLQKQVMVTGEKVNMTFKTFESYNVEGVIHMGLYLVPRGQDMITTNSIAGIEWDKGKPVVVKDPSKILHNATVSSNSDDTFQYTKFSFIPAKSYNKMSFLVRAWNDHMYSTDVRVHDAVEIPPPPKILPPGVVKYDNFEELTSTLYKDQFYKPEIMAHIHDVNEVFPDSGGNVYWLYNIIEHSVTVVISDTNDNELFEYKELLQPYDAEKKPDYGFMNFTSVQLNRQNVDQIQKAIKIEEYKAMTTQIAMKITRDSKW